MKNYIKTANIEYRVFDNGVKCLNRSLVRKYSSGRILICNVFERHTYVYSVIKTDFKDPEGVISDIKNIPLPKSEYCYFTICILPKEGNDLDLDMVRYIIRQADQNFTCNKTALIYEIADTDKECYFIANLFIGINDEFFIKEFGLTLYRSNTISLEPKTDDSLLDQIQKWFIRTSFKAFKEAIETRVRGQENLKLILTNIYLYLQCIAKEQKIPRLNMILTAPSGCGKTETQRALKEYFKTEIPKLVISLIDMNQITSEGFKGHDTKYIVSEIKAAHSDGIGIVFLDEFDKRLMPQHSGSGDNVNGEIQHQLLEAVEGYMLDGIDTSKTMFIGMGSFDMVRAAREAKAKNTKKIGFGVESTYEEVDHFGKITREEMLELGACNELIGRFGQIVCYGPLSSESIDEIIDMRVSDVSEEFGVKVTISNQMRIFLHENSNTKFGNRLIKTLISETVGLAMSDILLDEIDCKEILVTGKNHYKIVKDDPAL